MPDYKGRNIAEFSTDTFRRVGAALSTLCGGYTGGGPNVTTEGITFTFRVKLDGDEFEVVTVQDSKKGTGFVGVLDTVPTATLQRVLRAFDECLPRYLLATTTVSLGFDSLVGPVAYGGALVAPDSRGREHGGRVARNGTASGEVYDHEIAFPVLAYGWSSGDEAAGGLGRDYVALLSFILDRPVAQLGHAHVQGGRSYPTEAEALAALPDLLRAAGCRLEEREVEGTHARRPVSGFESFVAAIARIGGRDRGLLDDTLLSYARAWLLAEPEPGMERYEDKSVAVMLWCTIVEGLSPVLPTAHCSVCNKETKGGSNDRTRAFLPFLAKDVSWTQFNKIRGVRHKVAHEARRQMPGLHDLHGIFDLAAIEALGTSLRYEHVSRGLARKAIHHFVVRGGNGGHGDHDNG